MWEIFFVVLLVAGFWIEVNILDVWKTFKFYGYRRIAAYSQQTDGPKVSEYMTLKLMRELGIKSRMQKRYRKPKTVVTVDQNSNLIIHLHDLSGV